MLRSAFAASALAVLASVAHAQAPRVVVIVLADDVGYHDVSYTRGGSNGTGEFATPQIDALAHEGIILEHHITDFMCTPSRCSLLTGRLPVHVQQGQAFPETPSAGIPRNMTAIAAKMKAAGFSTHAVGKWDAGFATPTHTPEGRGFDTSLVYAEHMNEYWTQRIFPGGTACTLINASIVDLWDSTQGGPARSLAGTKYIEFLFADRVGEVIANFSKEVEAYEAAMDAQFELQQMSSSSRAAAAGDAVEGSAIDVEVAAAPTPPSLFLYYAPHIAHYPLQVPQQYYDRFAFMTDDEGKCNATTPYIWPGAPANAYSCRRQKAAMLAMLDDLVGNLTSQLKALPGGLWDETLLLFSSDNGSPLDMSEAGGSNWPLRGGKYTSWEGGVRVPAFLSGGYLPASLRGTTQPGLIHIADWWSTLAALVNVPDDDPVAAAAGLPPPDSINMWPMIAGGATAAATSSSSSSSDSAASAGAPVRIPSPRTEVPFSPASLLSWPYKLQLGLQEFSSWGGPVYPNASSTDAGINQIMNCGSTGCLYNVEADPTEQNNIAAEYPALTAFLVQRLSNLSRTFWSNNDTGVDICPPGTLLCGCWAADNVWGGFFGPYQH